MPIEQFRARGPFAALARAALVAGAAAGGLASSPALAGPVTGEVVHGNVTFRREGNRTIITASDGSIIRYSSFDTRPGEIVRFLQPDEQSRVLNRITGAAPTLFQGTLLANGQVYILNPAGVVFAEGATVDVGGLYAAAGHLSDADFLDERNRFTDLRGSVVNDGLITADRVHLIGRHVANHGSIVSAGGVVTLLAGGSVFIREHEERITIRIDGVDLARRGAEATDLGAPGGRGAAAELGPGVENTGTIDAGSGRVFFGAGDLYALAIRNTGQVFAGEFVVATTGGGAIEGDFTIGHHDDDDNGGGNGAGGNRAGGAGGGPREDGSPAPETVPVPAATGDGLAEALPRNAEEIEDSLAADRNRLGPREIRVLALMGIRLRAPSPPALGAGAEAPRAARRFRRDALVRAVRRYEALFLSRAGGGDRFAEVKATLAGAWQAYAGGAEGPADGAGFIEDLEQRPDDGEAAAVISGLKSLFEDLRAAGLSGRELATCRRAVLGPVTPADMGPAPMARAIGLPAG